MDFTTRRARSFSRIGAYALLATFLIHLITLVLPLPLGQPERAFAMAGELLANSTVPLVALLFWYFGMADDALPALWECRLAGLLRPLLRLLGLLYLLLALAVFGLAGQIESSGVTALESELQNSLAALQQIREAVSGADDPAQLRARLEAQPGLLEAMDRENTRAGGPAPLADQRRIASRLIDRAEAETRQRTLRRRADVSGTLGRQSARSGLTALIYSFFYLAAGTIWPRSLAATVERVLDARIARQQEEEAHDEAEPDGDGDRDGDAIHGKSP